jgi:hypothetical protein
VARTIDRRGFLKLLAASAVVACVAAPVQTFTFTSDTHVSTFTYEDYLRAVERQSRWDASRRHVYLANTRVMQQYHAFLSGR